LPKERGDSSLSEKSLSELHNMCAPVYLKEHRDDGHNEQHMNESVEGEVRDHSRSPQQNEDKGHGPHKRFSSQKVGDVRA